MSQELTIPASPNWYCSSTSSCNHQGLYSFAARNQLFVYDITSKVPVFKDSFLLQKDRVTSVCWVDSEKHGRSYLASGAEDGSVKILDPKESKLVISEQKRHAAKISSIIFIGNNTLVSGDEKGLLVIWNYLTAEFSTWMPVQSAIFSMAALPQRGPLIAIGYANGHVLIVDVKRCEVLRQYKSHLDEVHSVMWQPSSHAFDDNTKNQSNNDGLLLASGSKDKTIRIWNIEKENPIFTLHIPSKSSSQKGRKKADETGRAKVWITLCWHRKETLISSSSASGDLLVWDLRTKDYKSFAPGHTRIVFNIAFDSSAKKIVTTSMDRQIFFWDSDSYELISSMPSLGGYVYSLSSSYLDPYNIIYGVGDNLIRVWNTRDNSKPYETSLLWQGIKSKITVVACHAKKENLIGFGTDDGHIGIYNVVSRKFEISISYHKKTVYSISWGPLCGDDVEGGTADGNWLYSCGGEGTILIHSMNSLQNKAKDLNSIIKKTNSVKEKLPSRSDIEWKRDLKFVAIGNDDGSVEIFASPNLRKICIILVHRKIINCMKWHHQFDIQQDEAGNGFSNWLATGSSDNYVCVTDLSSVINNGSIADQKQIVIKEKFRYFNLHSQRITCLSWSPHSMELLASSSYDGSVQIWNVNTNEPISNFRSHGGRVLCVLWSLVDPDVVYSGSEDFTLRKWIISSCKHKLPQGANKHVSSASKRTDKSNTQNMKPEIQSQLQSSLFQGGNAIVATVTDESTMTCKGENRYLNAVSDDMLTGSPAMIMESSSKSVYVASQPDLKPKAITDQPMRRSTNKGDAKKKKPKSLLPLSASQNHKQKAASQKECVMLAQYLKDSSSFEDGERVFEPGKAEYVNLGLFGDRPSAFKMFSTEGQNHAVSGNFEQQLHLELWKGNLGGALKACKEKGELNELVVAMSPLGGFDVWQSTMKAFADQLASKGDFVSAASYYLSVNKVDEAINMFKAQNMFKEAIALAKVRLPSNDPSLIELYRLWGERQSAEGCYENAAKCFIAAGDYDTGIRILARKGDVTSLKTAAEVACIYNKTQIADAYLKQCSEALLADLKWKEVKEVLKIMQNSKGHTLLSIVHELLLRLLCGTESDEIVNISTNVERNGCFILSVDLNEASVGETKGNEPVNASKQPTRFLQIICDTFFRDFESFPTAEILQNRELSGVQSYKVGNPGSFPDLKISLLSISYELVIGIVNFLDGELQDCFRHWLQAIDIAYHMHQFEVVMMLYKLLLPRDFITMESIIASYSCQPLKNSISVNCLDFYGNFHAYYKTSLLFQFWWKRFPGIMNCRSSIGDEVEQSSNEISLDRHMLIPSKVNFEHVNREHLFIFISGIATAVISSLQGRIAQLKSAVKTLEHNILEAKIKRQLQQHIISKSEAMAKTKSTKLIQKASQSVTIGSRSNGNWREREDAEVAEDRRQGKEEVSTADVVKDSKTKQEIDLLGQKIDVLDEESLKQMQKKNENMKQELEMLLCGTLDAPFPNCFENAKILLYIIYYSVTHGDAENVALNKKPLQLARDIITWGLNCSLSVNDLSHFEFFHKMLNDL